jgi:ribonuclease Z
MMSNEVVGTSSFIIQHSSLIDKDFFILDAGDFRIEGRSRSGHETYYRIRELGIALDIGRCPDLIVGAPQVFITHAHVDHCAGIAFYGAQRHLQRMPVGRLYVPAEAADGVREILALHQRLANSHWTEVEVVGLGLGDAVPIPRGREVRVHRASHRVDTNAYEVRDGERSLLFYTGDTDRELLERNETMFRSEVLIIECSFLEDGDQERAAKYRHIHFDDIADFAERFENRLVVLSHFSRRYSRSEIRDEIARRCPAVLRERLRLALPEAYQRVDS